VTGVIGAAINHTRSILLTLAFILIAGWIAYGAIPKEAEPDVAIPFVSVTMTHDGISPEDAERLIVRPMEQELRSLEGLKEMTASAYEGGADITLEFHVGIDTGRALQDTRERVDTAKTKLPSETEDPLVREIQISRIDPMLVMHLSGPLPERALVQLARSLRDRIEGIPGVLDVEMAGDREELMEVVIDPLAMESYGLDYTELFRLVDRNNRVVAAGALDTGRGRFPIKVPGVFESAEDVLELPVKVDGERVVRFRDIAEVRRTYKDRTSYARIDGHPAIAMEVVKRAGANIISTIEDVRSAVELERADWPASVQVTYSRDKSTDILDMLTDLQNNVLTAVLLVFIVIIGILGFRSALLVGIAIPGSFLAAILILAAAGLTINMIVLFSLIMAVGMLVDGAIVVVELADRKMAEGLPRKLAYEAAARRMAWPIIAATATTIAAFLPLVFWPGITGDFMSYLPITLIATLSASLLMALVFVPTLGGVIGAPGALSEGARRQLAAAESGDLDDLRGYTRAYLRVLQRALRHPWWTTGAITALLLAIFIAYALVGRGVEFFPDVEPEFARVQVAARGDLSVDEKDAIMREVERRVQGMTEFKSLYARAGGSSSREDIIGVLSLQLIDWELRRPAAEILDEIRERTADLAGVHIETLTPRAGPGGDRPIRIEVGSRHPERIEPVVARIRALMDSMDGLVDVEDSRPLPGIEWRLAVDRGQAARFGADVTLVGNTVQLVTNGIKLGEYRPDDADEEIDIRVRFPWDARDLGQIDRLRVPTAQGQVPISTFVTLSPGQKVSTISRVDMRRTMTLAADVRPGVLASEKFGELQAAIAQFPPVPGVDVRFRGDDEDQREASEFLTRAMLVAVGIIAIILVTQFNSIFQAFLILTAVLFSSGGVLLGHLLLHKPFGIIMSGVGMIALAGIVVNNNIVLIDTYNLLRRTGMDAMEAILRTCAQRLRPVLLTTVTTILGLLPMVLGVNLDLVGRHVTIGGPSAQWWTQLSGSVAGGLAFATLLTLLLTPSLLVIQARMEERKHARDAAREATASGADAAGSRA
jgi:multidrug efflux pump